MKCPFRISRDIVLDKSYNTYYKVVAHENFENCHGDDCPFYYVDENDVGKCARCDGGEEEL